MVRCGVSGELMGLALLVASCGGSAARTDGGGGDDAGQAGGADGGGNDGGSACPSVSPCGGDLVGTWQVTQACLSGTEDLNSTCPGASATITSSFTGTVIYNSNNTYTSMVTGGGTTHFHYPGACLPAGYTCTQFSQLLMSVGSYSSVNCATDAASVCNCDAVTASLPTDESGTYTSSGVTVTTVHSGSTSIGQYCIQGNVMYQMETPRDGGATEVVVLRRQ